MIRRVAILVATTILASCGSIGGTPSASLQPLELMAAGADPGALDWYIPAGSATMVLLDHLDPGRLDATRRALLQRDLWMSFDTGYAREDRAALRARLAVLLRRTALPAEEIGRLPDTYAESVKLYPTSFDPAKPEQPFLPADLFDPNGPWIALHSDGVVAFQHDTFFANRSAFIVFVRHPEGRDAGLRFVEGLAKRKSPEIPVGMAFANVRRGLLISDGGTPVPSPFTESVQLRHYWGRNGNEQAVFKFELGRRDLRLRPLRPNEAKPGYAVSFEHVSARQSLSIPVMSTCLDCHGAGGAGGVQVLQHNMTVDYHLRPGTPEQEMAKVVRRKTEHDSWRALEALWRAD